MNGESGRNEVKVWDPLVRIFHWALAAAFFIAYLSEGDEWITLHSYAGYTLMALLLVRLLWGFIGPRYARFSDFVRRPGTVAAYLREVVSLRPRRYLGHNPAGGLMILLLFAALFLTGLSGLAVYAADAQAGPLAPWLGTVGHDWEELFEEVHEFFANLSLLLVAIHVAGVLVESLLHRENLVRSMITGRKRA